MSHKNQCNAEKNFLYNQHTNIMFKHIKNVYLDIFNLNTDQHV